MKRPRCAIPRGAASTMPTIRPASKTSRNTMIRLASIDLLQGLARDGGNRAVRRIRMIVVEEFVGPGLQRPRHYRDLSPRDDDLLHAQVGTLEFGGRRVLVLNLNAESLAGRHTHVGGHKPL